MLDCGVDGTYNAVVRTMTRMSAQEVSLFGQSGMPDWVSEVKGTVGPCSRGGHARETAGLRFDSKMAPAETSEAYRTIVQDARR